MIPRGVVLVQVLVLSIVLSMTATMLVQWQYGRYVVAYRVENSHRARAIAMAAYAAIHEKWFYEGRSAPYLPTSVTINDPVSGSVTATVQTSGCGISGPEAFCFNVVTPD